MKRDRMARQTPQAPQSHKTGQILSSEDFSSTRVAIDWCGSLKVSISVTVCFGKIALFSSVGALPLKIQKS